MTTSRLRHRREASRQPTGSLLDWFQSIHDRPPLPRVAMVTGPPRHPNHPGTRTLGAAGTQHTKGTLS